MQRSLLLWLFLLLAITAVFCFPRCLKISPSRSCSPLSCSAPDLDGELNKFFESTARSGASKFKDMKPEERMEYTIRGAALEDDIFELRDRMNAMESAAIEGQPLDVERLKIMREELAGLKQDYIDLVGGEDLPIYFGKSGYDDVLQ